MDILLTKTLLLNEYGIDGKLNFRSYDGDTLQSKQAEMRALKDNESGMLKMMDAMVRDQFIDGEVNGETFEELGKLDITVLTEAFALITGSSDKKK
jgi:hypothetical protein